MEACNYEKGLLLQTMDLVRQLGSPALMAELLSHLEEFSHYIHRIEALSAKKKSGSLESVSDFANNLRQYQVVEDPLDDLCAVLLVLATLASRHGWSAEAHYARAFPDEASQQPLPRTFEAAFGVSLHRVELLLYPIKQAVENYVDRIEIPAVRRKSYLVSIHLLTVACMHLVKERQFEEDPGSPGLTLGGINAFSFNLLSTDDIEGCLANAVNYALRCFAYRLSAFPAELGLASCTKLSSVAGFLQAFSPFLNEQSKFTILNYPSSHAALLCLRVLHRIAAYNSNLAAPSEDIFGITVNLLVFLQTVLDKYQRSSFAHSPKTDLLNAKMFGSLLQTVLGHRQLLAEDCRKKVEAGELAPSNYIRHIGLKVYPAVVNCKSGELLEVHWRNLKLIIECLHETPSLVEDAASPWSANEPANCVIDSSSGPFVVEIWNIILGEVAATCSQLFGLEDSLGKLVFEFAVMKSRTREAHLSDLLKRWLLRHWQVVPEALLPLHAKLVAAIKALTPPLRLTAAPGASATRQTANRRGHMVLLTEILKQIHATVPHFFRMPDRLPPASVSQLLVYCLCVPLTTIDSVKTCLNVFGLFSDAQDCFDPETNSLVAAVRAVLLDGGLGLGAREAARAPHLQQLAALLAAESTQ